jgi:hypothetical protein
VGLMSLTLTQGPKNKLRAAVTTGLPQQHRNVSLDGAATQGEGLSDGPIAVTMKHESEHPMFRWTDGGTFERGDGDLGGWPGGWPHWTGAGTSSVPLNRRLFVILR